ncbi:unnamed protein product [Paramecium sonneborni]|uniref:Uncharacterized protein n=1 Tax=Paramecium sonneborni TaxID=65129 RepID=A0A8S1R909_9CILI|nr:unnamed protein product [Paramecium sonneborni]
MGRDVIIKWINVKFTLEGMKCQWAEGSCFDIQQSCLLYFKKSECINQSDGQICIWIDGSCYNRQCKHAPKSYSTYEQCQKYGKNCTTNGMGCTNYKKCSEYKYLSSCQIGSDGQCTLVNQCQKISCESAPTTLKTDSECSNFLNKCTTNGQGCIERRRCQDAYIEEGCKYNSQGGICVWFNDQCYDKTCETADKSVDTEKSCEEYYPKAQCTTKLGGGCIQKSKCKDVQIEIACTTQYDGQKCQWQDGVCSLIKSCSNIKGTDHKICNTLQNDCTSDGKQCVPMQTCSNTLKGVSCVQGTDGPCLWSNQQCYRYTKCTDLIFSTHQECNQIHSQCTTNGYNCIAINTCANTPKIGCYVGIKDNNNIQCIWAPRSNKQSAIQQCTEFKKCQDVYYLNHNDCYNYSQSKCTTDGINGCIPLDSCDKYDKQVSCVIDKAGKIINKSGDITSTGFCFWNNNKCISQECSQLIGTTHQQCNSQLSKCTSNGQNCLLQSTCSIFSTYNSCIAATGTDGKCTWLNNLCNSMKCSDYPVAQCSLFSTDCIRDGLKCQEINHCFSYKTQSACENGFKNSFCKWVNINTQKDQCIEIQSCEIVNDNEKTCKNLSDRCYWYKTTSQNQTSYTCAQKKCEIQTNNTCTGFYDWDKQNYTICILDSKNQCVPADPSTLTQEDCFTKTLYQYTWDSTSNKCQICNPQSIPNNTTDNKTDNKTGQFTTILLPTLMAILFLQI